MKKGIFQAAQDPVMGQQVPLTADGHQLTKQKREKGVSWEGRRVEEKLGMSFVVTLLGLWGSPSSAFVL